MKMTITDILEKKQKGEAIAMLTAYDYPSGMILDEAGVDIVLVGDSLANVVLGLEKTTEVGMQEMIYHTKAVARGVQNALLIGDMPYEAYQKDISDCVENAGRFAACGCDAVKLEWFDGCLEATEKIIKAGIPVMGHIGLTPQTAEQLGGFKVQGRDAESAGEIVKRALALEKIGCFAVVLECVPASLARFITERLKIPTISIGAGVHCDGQVLVLHDLLNLYDRKKPKFVKSFADIRAAMTAGIRDFIGAVKTRAFPDEKHSYGMDEAELEKLKKIFND